MFALKFVICISIVVICSILGTRKSKKYQTRERMLQDFITTFKGVGSDIKYTLMSLPDAIEKIRHTLNTDIKDTLGAISVIMLSNSNMDEMNKKINEEINNIYELNSYDKEIVYQGLSNLGRADLDTQIGIVESTIFNLSNQLSEATEEKAKNIKLYRTLGTAIGLMIAIVFI